MTDEPAAHAPETAPEDRPRGLPPVAIPIVALAGILVIVFSASRILLVVSKHSAPLIALFFALNILVGAALVSAGRWVRNRPASFPLILLAGALVVAGGAIAWAIGPPKEKVERVAISVEAKGIQFTTKALTVPSDELLAMKFTNDDASTDHNVVIFKGADDTGTQVFRGELVTGPASATYNIPALEAGPYFFHCEVHPTMTGTITAAEGAKPSEGGPAPGPSPSPTPSGPPLNSPSPVPGQVTAQTFSFTPSQVLVHPTNGKVSLTFTNLDEGAQHNIVVFNGADDTAPQLFRGDLVTGVDTVTYSFDAPDPGDYFFHCEVHKTMTGTLTVQ